MHMHPTSVTHTHKHTQRNTHTYTRTPAHRPRKDVTNTVGLDGRAVVREDAGAGLGPLGRRRLGRPELTLDDLRQGLDEDQVEEEESSRKTVWEARNGAGDRALVVRREDHHSARGNVDVALAACVE